jgi:hypothetical protein
MQHNITDQIIKSLEIEDIKGALKQEETKVKDPFWTHITSLAFSWSVYHQHQSYHHFCLASS